MELEDIKEGDYVIYTEMPYSDYANSLNKIVSISGVLFPSPLCTEWKGEYISFTSVEGAIPVKDYFGPKNWKEATGYNPGDDPLEYMNKTMPLGEVE